MVLSMGGGHPYSRSPELTCPTGTKDDNAFTVAFAGVQCLECDGGPPAR